MQEMDKSPSLLSYIKTKKGVENLMRKNKGITLIALIITIIILLILVGVSVNLLIKGDLFGSAEKAVNGTNAKVEEQQTRVDELMGKLDKANIFVEGTEPKLKYEVFGNEIVIYLENSIYDYVLQKSINDSIMNIDIFITTKENIATLS